MVNNNYPMVLIEGRTGTGKTFSLKKLDPKTTRVINVENKPFPFRSEFNKLGNEFQPNHAKECDDMVDKALKDDTIDLIIIDSGLKYTEELMILARNLCKGFDIFNYFNAGVGAFLKKLKNNNGKLIIITWIDELVDEVSPDGSKTTIRRAAIDGKKWEGKIEKEFTIVLFTEVTQVDKAKPPSYRFLTNNNGTHAAKSPPGLFGASSIENDLKLVSDKIFEYYGLTRNSEKTENKEIVKAKETVVLKETL